MTCFFLFFSCSGDPRDLHSFPTRRSSDLRRVSATDQRTRGVERAARLGAWRRRRGAGGRRGARIGRLRAWTWTARSEEHTSELQSLTNLVCRLLLEKKKKIEMNNAY